MAQIRLENFAHAVRRANSDANVRVDLGTGRLKVGSSQNRFNRVISWFRSKLSRSSPPPAHDDSAAMLHRQGESSSAYNAFRRAISNDFYAKKDIDEKVKPLLEGSYLEADMDGFREKGLSARLVKQVIGQLNKKECSNRREIVKTAYYMASKKDPDGDRAGNHLSRSISEMVEQRPRLVEADYRMEGECKEALSERIFAEVMKKTESNDAEVKNLNLGKIMEHGQSVVEKLVNETLDAEETRLFGAQPSGADEAESGSQVQANRPQGNEEAQAPQTFTQELKMVEIPAKDKLQKQLDQASLAADDKAGGVKLVNKHTVEWIEENRLQRWYQEAISSKKVEGDFAVPLQLQKRVKASLTKHGGILPYQDAKAQTKAIIKSHVEAHDPRSLPGQLTQAGLPKEVDQQLRNLIDSGDIVSQKDLVEHGNKSLASWVKTNRTGKWYREALQSQDVPLPFTGAQVIPGKLVDDISDAITSRHKLWSYPLLKDHARQIVNTHVEQEFYGTRV